jgi:hypothetical protein
LANDELARQELSAALQGERAEQIYHSTTVKLVSLFQVERGLQRTGEVDEPTAGELNALLEELGAFDSSVIYHVTGRVASRVSTSVGGLRVVVVDKSVGGNMPLTEAEKDARCNYRASFWRPTRLFGGKIPPERIQVT